MPHVTSDTLLLCSPVKCTQLINKKCNLIKYKRKNKVNDPTLNTCIENFNIIYQIFRI